MCVCNITTAKGSLVRKLPKTRCSPTTECSHVEHFCEISYLNSLVHFSPVTVPVHCNCGMRKRVECKVWSVEWSVKCKLCSMECRVWSVECGVQSVECRVWTVK